MCLGLPDEQTGKKSNEEVKSPSKWLIYSLCGKSTIIQTALQQVYVLCASTKEQGPQRPVISVLSQIRRLELVIFCVLCPLTVWVVSRKCLTVEGTYENSSVIIRRKGN